MAAYSDYEQVWLIKTAGVVLGPFSLIEVIQGIQDRRISILDEVRSPTTRWGFVREHPQLSEIVKVIRDQDSDRGQITGITHASLNPDLTRSITHEVLQREDLTPTPIIEESKTQSSVEIKALERRVSNPEASKVPKPLSKGQALPLKQKSIEIKQSYLKWAAAGAAVILILLGVLVIKNQGPKTMSAEEMIKLGQMHRSMGYYDKALINFHRAQEMKRLGASVYLQMIPLELAMGKQAIQVQRMLDEVEKDKRIFEANKNEIGNWRALMLMSQGEYLAAEQEFKSILAQDPFHKKVLLNRGLNFYFLNQFEESLQLIIEAQRSGLSHPFASIVKALNAIHLAAEAVSADQSAMIQNELMRWWQVRQEFRAEISLIRATYAHRLGRSAEALAAMKEILNINPDISKDYVPELDVSYQIIAWERLFPYCERLADSYKDLAVAKGLLAFCFYKKGDMAGALKQIDFARKQHSSEGILNGLHAFLLLQSSRVSEAKAVLQLETQELFKFNQLLRAGQCFEEKNLACSQASLNELVNKKIDSVEIYMLMAKVYKEKSQKEMAKQEIEKGLGISGNYRPLIEMREELNAH
ncbi:MAG: hypothetical protein BroJett040_21820 [Oligoflexia bacterium]|nr:MAG: hypothetical protein BroJett040_21820 [Oligoflexia bacterium]